MAEATVDSLSFGSPSFEESYIETDPVNGFVPVTYDFVEPQTVGSVPLYEIASGEFPNGLSLAHGSGTVTVVDPETGLETEQQAEGCIVSGAELGELDIFVPAFAPPAGYVIAKDGSNYDTYGSKNAGSYTCTFTIRVYASLNPSLEDFVTVSLLVYNNYRKDRDKFIVDYTEAYGEGTPKKLFKVNGVPVTAQDYIDHQISLGNF